MVNYGGWARAKLQPKPVQTETCCTDEGIVDARHEKMKAVALPQCPPRGHALPGVDSTPAPPPSEVMLPRLPKHMVPLFFGGGGICANVGKVKCEKCKSERHQKWLEIQENKKDAYRPKVARSTV